MGGIIFRLGDGLKNLGERLGCKWLIARGYRMRDFVFQKGVIQKNGKIKIEFTRANACNR